MHALILAVLLGAGPYSGAVYDSTTGSCLPISGGTLTGDLTLPFAGILHFGTARSILKSTSNGRISMEVFSDDGGVGFDFGADGVLSLYNQAFGSYASLNTGSHSVAGNVTLASGSRFIYESARTDDNAAYTATIMSGNAYGGAATNTSGGSLGLYGGLGNRKLIINATTGVAGLAGDTWTITRNGSATVLTEGAGGGQINCTAAGLTAAQCACAYYSYLIATPITGVTPGRTDASCSDGAIWFTPTAASTYSLTVVPSDVTAGTLTQVNGADGQVLVGDAGISFVNDTSTDSKLYRAGENIIRLTSGGATALEANSGNISTLRLSQWDVGATCTLGALALDTGGATPELCYCQATNTWYCISFTTLTGPTD